MNRLVDILITQNGKAIKKYTLEKNVDKRLIVGSDVNTCSIVIKNGYVSRNQFELLITKDGRIFITDLNSTNGTFIKGKRIPAKVRIEVKIGSIVSFTPDSSLQVLLMKPYSSAKNIGVGTNNNGVKAINKICIGRNSDCDIHINTSYASKVHAFISKNSNGTYTITDNFSLNGTFINERLLTGNKKIELNDTIRIGNFNFTLNDYLKNNLERKQKTVNLTILLQKKGSIIIGRSKSADYYIKDNSISRKHAKITVENGKYYIVDLGSLNGTFVNGNKINNKTQIKETDEIRISFHVFKLNGISEDLSELSAIRAVNISKVFSSSKGKYVAVKPISFSIPSKSFIALMGPSGCGKSTLMNMLSGFNPATEGKVYIHGLELISNIGLLKQKIGFVPQDDIVHKDLTVDKALYYAAKLRLNKDTTEEEIKNRIDEVCTNLKINSDKIRKNLVKKLSGGQRKRVSIAVELLNNPTILFLDEPTSPLDPETIDSFLTSIRELARKENTTVVMVTHKPEDLKYVDRVIFMGTEGYSAFYGSENKMLEYFKVDNIVKIYAKLSNKNEANNWYEKWKQNEQRDILKSDSSEVNKKQKTSLFNQFYWLTKRYANIKVNDKSNMLLLLLQPLVIPLALVFIYEKLELGMLFLMAITSIWFGVSNAAKEIVEEIPIYLRERMYNLNIFTYIISKITILSLIAVVQIAIYVVVLYFSYNSAEIHLVNIFQVFLLMFYLTFSATLLGLLLSVVFKSSEQVMTIIPIVLIPQIIFAGVISEVDTKGKEVFSYLMYGRWGTEALARIQSDSKEYETYVYTANDTIMLNLKNKNIDNEYLIKDKYNNNVYYESVYDVCNNKDNDKDIIDCKPTYNSVYQKTPKMYMTQDTLLLTDDKIKKRDNILVYVNGKKKYAKTISFTRGKEFVKADPIELLGFYKNKKLYNKFNSFKMNILAITLINFLIFLLTLVFIKKKDKV